MSGMLPGVESARRRRLHSNSSSRDFISGSSLCLYANRKLRSPPSSSLLERNTVNQADPDENLGVAALEAKRRLDQRFAAYLTTENTSQSKSLFGYFVRATQSKLR
ncbi:hypothetical protein LR48_Vigan01g249500 [Vigna angularis]|uniref:Uncharacterized protein n=2 Tax=Phaseolus angularis TaxID=3914 RepID=A0A0L9TS38_PHAAN|nr:uncharacterized protein LOC108339141 [Vigna angularis]KOM32939.1 hypothetical protein LR48_Vigan01g249500 [Vigna angularis]BAT76244.1 hypothetical protein VIGAN_01422000 [Vigna angularis var. angularis]